VHLAPGESQRVEFELSPRSMSLVDAAGARAISAGHYRIFVGGGQPGYAEGVAAVFTINGHAALSP